MEYLGHIHYDKIPRNKILSKRRPHIRLARALSRDALNRPVALLIEAPSILHAIKHYYIVVMSIGLLPRWLSVLFNTGRFAIAASFVEPDIPASVKITAIICSIVYFQVLFLDSTV